MQVQKKPVTKSAVKPTKIKSVKTSGPASTKAVTALRINTAMSRV